jgi:putative zinc finger protein
MNCLRAEELLSDYQEGELHELMRRELEAHLATCANCPPLAAALGEVLDLLRATRARLAAPEIDPAGDLAARVAEAAIRAGRTAPAAPRWRAVLPARLQTMAAGIAIFATATVMAGRTAMDRRWPQRLVSEAATAGVHVIERKDRALEDLRMLRVIVGATFEGRVDRVTERVDDYRRLLERRRSSTPGTAAPASDRPQPEDRAPGAGAGAASPRPVSAAGFAEWTGHACFANCASTGNVREG